MRNLYKPNRYNVASIQAQQTLGGDVMQSAEDGDYVEWRDYKRVLNEIELLNGTVKYWEIEARTDHDRWLRCLEDVERLRKAGDELVKALLFEDGESCKEIADWNKAKEGKQS